MEAIILAGGLGTRLRGVIGDAPKCMAPVNGRPFLAYLLRYLEQQQATRIVLSLGYRSEVALDWLNEHRHNYPFAIDHVIEQEPMGTGGGIQLALAACTTDTVAVVNGDTLFSVDLRAMLRPHQAANAETTIALKIMRDFDRYGIVQTSGSGAVTEFEEKAPRADGRINGGIYMIGREAFSSRKMPQKFSFEKDYLERFVAEGRFSAFESDGYFIDIGVPADYEKAQDDFKTIFPQS